MQILKTLIVIRHVPEETLNHWESIFRERGFRIFYKDADKDDIKFLQSIHIDVLCILGGPLGAYEEEKYPFLLDEIALIQNRIREDLPTIGICLGCQLIARALGEKVFVNNKKEVGWAPLEISEEGKHSFVKHLSKEKTSMFHWHLDTFNLPKRAKLLASTAVSSNQIFLIGNTLGFQCHPEFSENSLENFLKGIEGINEKEWEKLQEDTLKFLPKLKEQSKKCLEEWLELLED